MTETEPDPVMVTMQFEASDLDRLTSILAKYVVVSRSEPGCRNVDLVSSMTTSGRLLVVEKWDSVDAQRAHFDGTSMVEMAQACEGILSRPPQIDIHEGISMHDLA